MIWKDGRSVNADKARTISNLLGYFRMIWKALESKDGAEGVQMFEPYALIPLAWSSLLIGRIAKGLLSLGQ